MNKQFQSKDMAVDKTNWATEPRHVKIYFLVYMAQTYLGPWKSMRVVRATEG